jgi:Cu(I)/Ag(I) efflux system protein CusF
MKTTLIASFAVVLAHPASPTMAQQKADDTKAAAISEPKGAKQPTHSARGTVKRLDVAAGVVVLAHGPVKSLNWPSMTMGFKVGDKALLDKLAVGNAVDFEFTQADKGYVVTHVK